MSRFFVDKKDVLEHSIIIRDVKHITKALRLNVGDTLTVCDDCGRGYTVRITAVCREYIETDIVERMEAETENGPDITLFQGIPKGGKMEYVIQKATELGVARVTPVITTRVIAQTKEGNKLNRWKRIAQEAAKQCGRGMIPTVDAPIEFGEALDRLSKTELAIMPYELAQDGSLRTILQNQRAERIGIFIGPEGGFEPNEAAAARAAGVNIVTLGKRILRTETAGAAVLAMILYEYLP